MSDWYVAPSSVQKALLLLLRQRRTDVVAVVVGMDLTMTTRNILDWAQNQWIVVRSPRQMRIVVAGRSFSVAAVLLLDLARRTDDSFRPMLLPLHAPARQRPALSRHHRRLLPPPHRPSSSSSPNRRALPCRWRRSCKTGKSVEWLAPAVMKTLLR